MSSTVNLNSNIPYYLQLIDVLQGKIENGQWQPGDQIPTEHELCRAYGVSRTVVRQALQELERKSGISRRKGKGTFVAHPKIGESLVQKLTGFHHDMVAKGFHPKTRVLHHRVVPSSQEVAHYLEIAIGEPVMDIHRLRFINEEPIQLVNTFIPADLCRDLADVDLTDRSLYEFLEDSCALHIVRGRRFIEAVAADDSEAENLEINPGDPLILLNSVSYLEDGRAVEYYRAVHRGDRSRFEVELVREPQVMAKKVITPYNRPLPNSEASLKESRNN